MFEWSVDTNSGVISETKRNDETHVSVTTEKIIDPTSLSRGASNSILNGQYDVLKTDEMSDDVLSA